MTGNGDSRRCEHCKFWAPQAGSTDGQCRVRAPIAMMVGTKEIKAPNGQVIGGAPVYGSAWPAVGRDRWCGEFQRKETLQ